jgi:alanyl-tRNA synthetase
LVVAVGPSTPKTYQANLLVQKLAPLIEGKGGGKPDFSQAGGMKAAGLEPMIAEARKLLEI